MHEGSHHPRRCCPLQLPVRAEPISGAEHASAAACAACMADREAAEIPFVISDKGQMHMYALHHIRDIVSSL